MHGLGIPTTRSLAVVTTGDWVFRDTKQPGAILTRIAASHLRIGTFQYAAKWGTPEDLRILADYTIARHFPEIRDKENPYLSLFQEVIKGQAILIAKWQLVGFIHGVMNTDNTTISGETIDYGPCAFMDTYDPKTVFSSIDTHGRYAYGNQPKIAEWNLARFAEALLPLIDDNQEQAVNLAQETLLEFNDLYKHHWLSGMRAKLGIRNQEREDEALIENLLSIMEKYKADYTNTFRALTFSKDEDTEMFRSSEYAQWKKRWENRLVRQKEGREASRQLMINTNPAIIPRNHRVEEALEAAVEHGDYTVMERLLEVLQEPFAHSPQQEEYTTVPLSRICYKTFCGT